MNATEEAVEAAARAEYERQGDATRHTREWFEQGGWPDWDAVPAMTKFRFRAFVLPVVQAAFSTLPEATP